MGAPGFVPQRQLVLVDLLAMLLAVNPGERAVVAIDGVDGAGKSRLSAELRALAGHVAGRQVLGVSVDGFHQPAAARYRDGRGPETFYRDSYDYDAFRRLVLDPFRAGLEITPAWRDVASDEPVRPDPVEADDDALLLVDGIFLHRDDLAGEWDASVWVEVPFSVSVPRSRQRDAVSRPELDDPEHPENHRYVGGQRLYLDDVDVLARCRWVVDNTDLRAPVLHHAAELWEERQDVRAAITDADPDPSS